jgi:outer membrane autotransporter protein
MIKNSIISMVPRFATVVALSTSAGTASAQSENLVTNGSFEDATLPPLSGGYYPNVIPDGWTTTANQSNVYLVPETHSTVPGNSAIDGDLIVGGTTDLILSQTINLSGKAPLVIRWWANNEAPRSTGPDIFYQTAVQLSEQSGIVLDWTGLQDNRDPNQLSWFEHEYTTIFDFEPGTYEVELFIGGLSSVDNLIIIQLVDNFIYEAAPHVLLDGMTRMPTLEQRVGQRRWNSAAGTLEPSSGGWVRTFGDWSEADLNTGTSYDVDTWGLQAGFDLPVEPGEDGQWVLGLTAQTGNTSADIATMTGTGAINAESLGVGATATWHGYNDLYVDLQGQVNWASVDYSSSLHGQLAEDELARTAAASIEVGRRFALDENRGLIPQAQLTWASVDGGSFTDSAGNAIDLGTNERVTGRLGVAYDYEWSSDDGESMQNVYAIANVLHDFSNDASVGMAGARLASERDATWGEIGLGGSVTWDENKTLYAEASYRDSFGSGSGSGFSANAGLRVQW